MFLGKHLLILLDSLRNGTLDAFGVVTRVWTDEMVNLVIFPDADLPMAVTSVPVVADREAAEALRETYAGHIAYFPPSAA